MALTAGCQERGTVELHSKQNKKQHLRLNSHVHYGLGTAFYSSGYRLLFRISPGSMSAAVYLPETTSGVVTSWIPLTTVFTSSVGCSGSFRLDGPSLVAFDPKYGLDINPGVNCQLPAVTTWSGQSLLGSGPNHTAVSISPLTYPEGWKTLATSTRDHSSALALCCPP